MKPRFPSSLSTEFLLVDMLNNLDTLAEDTDTVLERVKKKLPTFRQSVLMRYVREYGSIRTKKFFALLIDERAKK